MIFAYRFWRWPWTSYFALKGLDANASAPIYFFTFAANLFGWSRATTIRIAGFGVMTCWIVFLPDCEVIRVSALVQRTAMCFVDGVFWW